jgi:coiled-coil domain-containing protein 130
MSFTKGPRVKTKIGIQKRTGVLQSTVSDSLARPSQTLICTTLDTEAPSAAEPPADPFAHIEKTIDQQTWAQTKKTRLSELYDASDRLSSDPYLVSSALRRKFRVEKGLMLDRQRRDDEFRDKYGLSLELDLGGETPVGNVKGMWEAGRERRGLPSHTGEASGSGAGVSTRATKGTPSRKGKERDMDGFKTKAQLAQSLRATTSRKYDPFASAADTLLAGSPGGSSAGLKVKTKTKDPDKVAQVNTGVRPIGTGVSISSPVVGSLGGGLLAGYGSD